MASTYRKRGASMTGYGLIVGLIAIVGLAAVQSIGDGTNSMFTSVADRLGAVSGQASAAASTPVGPTPTPTFSFTSHTFMTCNTSGPFGPSQGDCRSLYDTSAEGNWD